jgi:hypothetical protein
MSATVSPLKQPPESTPGNRKDEMVRFFHSRPTQSWSAAEFGEHFGLKGSNIGYYVRWLITQGAIEKVPGKFRYQARAGYMSIEQKRQVVKDNLRPVEVGEPWRPGAQPVALTVRPHFKFREAHIASIRSRLLAQPTIFAKEDIEVFDDLVHSMFPPSENS